MDKILHQLIYGLSHSLKGFICTSPSTVRCKSRCWTILQWWKREVKKKLHLHHMCAIYGLEAENYTHGLRETHRILPTRSQRDHGWPLLSSFHGGACGKRSCSRTLGHHTSFYKRQSSLGLCGDLAKQALEDSRGDYKVLKLFYFHETLGPPGNISGGNDHQSSQC